MALPDIFSKSVSEQVIARIESLSRNSKPLWGKMNVAQMLAHCNVTYEMAFENKHKRPNILMALLLKAFVKKIVVSETPYKKNSQTAPEFIIKGDRTFETEKNRLISYIIKTVDLGGESFHNKSSLQFGKLSKTEWNNMFFKHLDHHLKQFGV